MSSLRTALQSVAEKAIIEMKKGQFNQLYVKGKEGHLLAMKAGLNAILTVSTTENVNFKFVLLDCTSFWDKIADIIK